MAINIILRDTQVVRELPEARLPVEPYIGLQKWGTHVQLGIGLILPGDLRNFFVSSAQERNILAVWRGMRMLVGGRFTRLTLHTALACLDAGQADLASVSAVNRKLLVYKLGGNEEFLARLHESVQREYPSPLAFGEMCAILHTHNVPLDRAECERVRLFHVSQALRGPIPASVPELLLV